MPTVTLIAAVCRSPNPDDDFVLAGDRGIPWGRGLKDDLLHFRKSTMGRPVIVGRKTFEEMGPLLDRSVVVLTRVSKDISDQNFWCGGPLEFIIGLPRMSAVHEVVTAGGAEVYKQALPLANRILLTVVDAVYEGKVFFPKVIPGVWRSELIQSVSKDDRNVHSFRIFELWRQAGVNQTTDLDATFRNVN